MIASRMRLRSTLARTPASMAVLSGGPPPCLIATSVLCSRTSKAACVITMPPTLATGEGDGAAAEGLPHAARNSAAQSSRDRKGTVERVYLPRLRPWFGRHRQQRRLFDPATERRTSGDADGHN